MATIPEGFIIPDFGTPPPASLAGSPGAAGRPEGSAAQDQSHPAGAPGPRKMAFICSKGNLDMAYPALIMGNAALGEGIEVHVFFTFWGLDIINKKTNGRLKFTMAGNTAMHMPDLGRLRPGLEHMSMPQTMANIPGMTAIATSMMKRQMADLEIPDVPEFLDLLGAAGAQLYACRLSFDMMKMIEADLHPAVQGVISATDFIEISQGAQIVFV
ncbi:MAG: DsrE/DsrF/DrsH-like family protein [Austwickia sp.]|jgi:peroxiredoxin family protein|nr:DsrE/DsrF/DrsH-like family protein [Austwickia sp.]MBK8436593.1 DsrE/DsrF/DrsH-like family protein [Austwickia sp.]MBK9102258.1 DsrE/DsrF/DrsH-like family protein [Austwickia sp.]